MALFADLAAMRARFEERDLLQLTDENNTGLVDEAEVEAKLASADALITSYVAARHANTAEFAGHELLTGIACDYAFFLLWRSNVPEWVKDRRDAAVAQLKDISKGIIKLDQGTEDAAPRPGQILISSDRQRFSRESLKGY